MINIPDIFKSASLGNLSSSAGGMQSKGFPRGFIRSTVKVI